MTESSYNSNLKLLLDSSIAFTNADTSYRLRKLRSVRDWVHLCIQKHDHEVGEITVVFCSDEYLLDMNREHLDHDYYTDIITFDYTENKLVSGDLFISLDRVKDNAKGGGTTLNDELHRVIIHGILHLMGYKDKTPADQTVMRSKEDYCLTLRTF